MYQIPLTPDRLRAELEREWLVTNGIGGFAMGTLPGVNTRRYHALLVAAVVPPVERVVAVRGLVEQLSVDGDPIDLWTQAFGEDPRPEPDGWERLTGVEVDPAARTVAWTMRAGAAEVRRELILADGTNAAAVRYRVRRGDAGDVTLRVRPITPLTPFHELRREGGVPPTVARDDDGRIRVRLGELELWMEAGDGTWTTEPDWWRELAYPRERDRGLDWREDAWSAGRWDFSAASEQATFTVRFGLGHLAPAPPERPIASADTPADPLGVAADQFIVIRARDGVTHRSIMAGYPWFADWGRDAMISLPGLLLDRGRIDEAASALDLFAASTFEGRVPSRFDDMARPAHYDHVDGSLWFIHAVGELRRVAPDAVSAAMLGACRAIVQAYRSGVENLMFMDDDGLIAAGGEGLALTWMDARRDGVAFTPRDGKPVEVNALWHHALRVVQAMCDDDGARRLADRVKKSFRDAFLLDDGTCCDRLVRDGDGWAPDRTLRPNQVIATSLRHSPVPDAWARTIVATVEERLLTPYGLRTLDPGHPDYRGRFEGPLAERDAAYHQGTVWPWLIGPYVDTVLVVEGRDGPTLARLRKTLRPLLDSLEDGCVGQIAEVYDGDAPHRAAACPAQAWSVAEVMRARRRLEA